MVELEGCDVRPQLVSVEREAVLTYNLVNTGNLLSNYTQHVANLLSQA